MAAANGIADEELAEKYIIQSIFNREVSGDVVRAV